MREVHFIGLVLQPTRVRTVADVAWPQRRRRLEILQVFEDLRRIE